MKDWIKSDDYQAGDSGLIELDLFFYDQLLLLQELRLDQKVMVLLLNSHYFFLPYPLLTSMILSLSMPAISYIVRECWYN